MLLSHSDKDKNNETLLTATANVEPPRPVVSQGPKVVDGTEDLSSVITQVTTRDSRPPRPYPARVESPYKSRAGGWRNKFRSIFCCFAPADGREYFKNVDNSQPSVRNILPVPPTPPRVYRESVIGPKRSEDTHKKTLVLDLDETLVHSSFKPIPNPDYVIPVEIDGKMVDVYVLKRPWMDHFMAAVCPRFEVIVFTASLSKYADPLLDLLDKTNLVRWRLFREACYPYEGNYVKDLNCLGRDLAHTIIVDNSPHSYVFQPMNAVPIGTFIDNMEDQELLDILPVIMSVEHVEDVREHLLKYNHELIKQQTERISTGYQRLQS